MGHLWLKWMGDFIDLNGWGIYDLNWQGIYGLKGWGIYDLIG